MELTVQMKVIFAIMKQRNSSKPRRKALKGNRIQDEKENTEMPNQLRQETLILLHYQLF